MTRKITINGHKIEVSKNEAKEAQNIFMLRGFERTKPGTMQQRFDTWLLNTTPEARARRVNVGIALGLKVPQ